MFKFVLSSYSFRVLSIITVLFIAVIFATSKIFDILWESDTSIPITNINDVYNPPQQYDNIEKINLKLLTQNKIEIEGNAKFRILGNNKTNFEFYDTVNVNYPNTDFELLNKIYLEFEKSHSIDSIFLVISKSYEQSLFYKQIFFSTITINNLNTFSSDAAEFRINYDLLVPENILLDNDTLINSVFKYFNDNKDTLGLAECGTNCIIFKKICEKFSLPCRLLWLQGGDINQTGYYNFIGYPQHVICEIYSSKSKKWYVVDPSYGFRFADKSNFSYLNAVEICNKHTFKSTDSIFQDSVLATRKTVVGKDYFKYYENIIFGNLIIENKLLKRAIRLLYSKFNYTSYSFSNNFPPIQNGLFYFGLKTFMYFFLIILYINSVMFVLIRRLFIVKKPRKRNDQ